MRGYNRGADDLATHGMRYGYDEALCSTPGMASSTDSTSVRSDVRSGGLDERTGAAGEVQMSCGVEESAVPGVVPAVRGERVVAFLFADPAHQNLPAHLVGLASEAVGIGSRYAVVREAFGQPIGMYQAAAHPFADAVAALHGAQLLDHKACWAMDSAHDDAGVLAAMAFVFAAETAYQATAHSLHVHGGYGFMEECDIELYYCRAKANEVDVIAYVMVSTSSCVSQRGAQSVPQRQPSCRHRRTCRCRSLRGQHGTRVCWALLSASAHSVRSP
ncbi:MAG: hypothetical protein QOI01_1487 [Mycobacterium sp.]|nr:hypothetical protein [Mycobacterium sp.]